MEENKRIYKRAYKIQANKIIEFVDVAKICLITYDTEKKHNSVAATRKADLPRWIKNSTIQVPDILKTSMLILGVCMEFECINGSIGE